MFKKVAGKRSRTIEIARTTFFEKFIFNPSTFKNENLTKITLNSLKGVVRGNKKP